MRTYYGHFAGQSLERLGALSDGIFAVAMTLLVLDLHVPVAAAAQAQQALWGNGVLRSELDLLHALAPLVPRLLTYLMGFLTLGMFWVGHQTQLNHFARSNRHLTWIHLTFLLAVAIVPFSTSLLATYITFRLALVVYWLNLVALGAVLLVSWRYAESAGLTREDATVALRRASERRIVIAQALYAASMLFCVFNTYLSIALIVLLQLNSAIAPRIFPLDRF